MKRELRTKFALMRHSLEGEQTSKRLENNLQCWQSFSVGDFVYALNLRSGAKWLPGVIIEVQQRNYYVQVGQQVWKRHEDQLRKRYATQPNQVAEWEPCSVPVPVQSDVAGLSGANVTSASTQNNDASSGGTDVLSAPNVIRNTSATPRKIPASAGSAQNPVQIRRNPERNVKLPGHLKDFVLSK
jgi:hypothetical protein